MITLELPYPPSTNRYWRRVGNRTVLSRAAREFRKRVAERWWEKRLTTHDPGFGRQEITVDMTVAPPDRRRRDLDNLIKPVLDALQSAGVFQDDAQVREITMRFTGCVAGGAVTVTVREFVALQKDAIGA